MSRKFTIAGAVLFIATFLAHPDQCVSANSIISALPDTIKPYAVHGATILSAILLAVGNSLVKKTPQYTEHPDGGRIIESNDPNSI